jgi:hypothetical protein
LRKVFTGAQVIQTGHLVCFSEPQEEELKIDFNLQIINRDGKTSFSGCSYAGYSVRDVKDEVPNWEVNQKSATLLSQLNGKGNSDKAFIDLLKIQLKHIPSLKNYRYQELKGKKI